MLALSPLIVFLAFYIILSLLADDFYAVPITVAFLVACTYSLLVMSGRNISQRFQILTDGAAKPDLMQMIWIFVLAGAFASTAKTIGAIDATVNLTLILLPPDFILCGLFLAACFISISVGTSVGTVAALTPIACGMAEQTGQSLALLTAIVVGGSFFGDNLSFISDTTIVATKSQGCEMKDKFHANIRIALPAALVSLILYIFIGTQQSASPQIGEINPWLVLPYIYILATSIIGMNVLTVLTSGTILAGFTGLALGQLDVFGWLQSMSNGIMGMSELIIVTLLAAGLVEAIKRMGGITFLIQTLSTRIHGRRGAELSIAALAVLADFCTANNTIAILTVRPLAREISARYHIPPKRSASLLDTFSCLAQGIIPYGAQMLIAAGLAHLNPLEIIPHLYYPFILGGMAILNIITHYDEKKYICSRYCDSNE